LLEIIPLSSAMIASDGLALKDIANLFNSTVKCLGHKQE